MRSIRLFAVLAAIAEVGIHLFLLQDHLMEKPYIGGLFIASAVILTGVILALGVPGRARSAAYAVGGLVSIGMFGSFIASRTIGLPLGYLEGWFSDYALGLPSLAFEVIFVACAVAALRLHRTGAKQHMPVAVADREDEALVSVLAPSPAGSDGSSHLSASDGEPVRLNSGRGRH
jgi:hypothetical protein